MTIATGSRALAADVVAAIAAKVTAAGGDVSATTALISRIGAQARTNASRFADTLSVLDFVAPSDAGDIGLAINRAHAAANPGDKLILPGSAATGNAYTLATPVVLSKAGVGLETGAIFYVVGGITAFTLSGLQNYCIGMSLYGSVPGTIAANSCGFSVMGFCCLVSDVTIEVLDNLIHQPIGANYGSTFRGLNMRNAGSRVIWIEDGVNTTVDDAIYDTDITTLGGLYHPPSVGGIVYSAQGALFFNIDILHVGGNGACYITPGSMSSAGAGNVYWTFFINCEFDTTVNAPGIHIQNNTPASGTGALVITGLFFLGCWSSTANQGVVIEGTGVIDLVTFTGCQFLNSSEQAWVVLAGENILFENCTVGGNATSVDPYAGTIYAGTVIPNPTVSLGTSGVVSIIGGRIAAKCTGADTGNPTYHIQTATTSGIVFLDGFSIDAGTGSNWVKPINNNCPAGYFQIGRIIGLVTNPRGTVSLAAGATSIAIAFSTFNAPAPQDIRITPLSPLYGATSYYIDPASISATGMTLRLIGTSTGPVNFAWAIDIIQI